MAKLEAKSFSATVQTEVLSDLSLPLGDPSQPQEVSDGVISEEVVVIFNWICYAVVCQIVDIFGTVTNIINIICFVKQGFKDPVNVSFLGLAISDLGSVVTGIWTNICFCPAFHETIVTFDTIEIAYLTSGWPHVIFTRITSWITALITVERCLCITVPLKVKSIITTKRITVIIFFIYTILIAGVSPIFYVNRLGKIFDPIRNRTMVGLVYAHDRADIEEIVIAINNLVVPFSAFVVVIFSTITLVVKLRHKTRWRKLCSVSPQAEVASDREQRVSKMVVGISCLFIACFIPISVTFFAIITIPGATIDGKYKNAMIMAGGASILLESLNSSLNIFIYYRMSSKYRAVFNQLFGRRNGQDNEKN